MKLHFDLPRDLARAAKVEAEAFRGITLRTVVLEALERFLRESPRFRAFVDVQAQHPAANRRGPQPKKRKAA